MKQMNPYLQGAGIGLVSMAVAIFGGYACGAQAEQKLNQPAAGVVDTTTTTGAGMTFAECQKSAEYPGGRYAVEYDNGVCTVQKPADTPGTTATTAAEVSFTSCAAAKEAGYTGMRRGEPGYSTKLDRDGDGVACDA